MAKKGRARRISLFAPHPTFSSPAPRAFFDVRNGRRAAPALGGGRHRRVGSSDWKNRAALALQTALGSGCCAGDIACCRLARRAGGGCKTNAALASRLFILPGGRTGAAPVRRASPISAWEDASAVYAHNACHAIPAALSSVRTEPPRRPMADGARSSGCVGGRTKPCAASPAIPFSRLSVSYQAEPAFLGGVLVYFMEDLTAPAVRRGGAAFARTAALIQRLPAGAWVITPRWHGGWASFLWASDRRESCVWLRAAADWNARLILDTALKLPLLF